MRKAISTTLAILALVVTACTGAASPTPPSQAPVSQAPASQPQASAAPSAAGSPAASTASCDKATLKLQTPGKLTIGTDNPAFGPYFAGPAPDASSSWKNADPNNGKGLEAALGYAIADKLGFGHDEVTWVAVPFANAIQPGPKTFDFDLNQVSYSAQRAQAVDLSDGYYDDNQAVVALKVNAIAKAASVADLKAFRLGTQIATTSLDYITKNIQPSKQPRVYNTLDAAIAALKTKQIDGLVADLATTFFIRDVQLDSGTGVIVGQLPTVGEQEHFSAVLDKGSPLTACVNSAIAALKADGTLEKIRARWIDVVEGTVPKLQ